jgi:hypothetical protein
LTDYGITFLDKHSYNDFGIWIKQKTIGSPKPQIKTVTVPGMSGTWDFSTYPTGQVEYDERELVYVFEMIENTKEECNAKKAEVEAWLFGATGKTALVDDTISGKFMAKCESIDVQESGRVYTLTANFTAYPFRILEDESEVI